MSDLERFAKIADERALKMRAKAKECKTPGQQHYFARAMEARVIADAIRAAIRREKTNADRVS